MHRRIQRLRPRAAHLDAANGTPGRSTCPGPRARHAAGGRWRPATSSSSRWPSAALLSSLRDPDAIVYRQQVLADCLEHPAVVRELYALAGEALKAEKSGRGAVHSDSPRTSCTDRCRCWSCSSTSSGGCGAMADEHADELRLSRVHALLRDARARSSTTTTSQTVEQHLTELKFKRGMLMSAELGTGNKGTQLHAPRAAATQRWLGRMRSTARGYSFTIPDRDDNGFRALERARGNGASTSSPTRSRSRSITSTASSPCCGSSSAFYVGCLNLHERLAREGRADLLPGAARRRASSRSPRAGSTTSASTLHLEHRVVGNDVDADGSRW